MASHILLTLIYLAMFLVIKPYTDPEGNKWEVFNELCVVSVSYILIVLNDTSANQEMRKIAGAFYVGICLFNFLVNAMKLVKSMVNESIP